MAAQRATDIRRAVVEVETHARELRERRTEIEDHLLAHPAASWPEAAAKVRYVLKLYVAGLTPEDTRHRDLVASILDDFVRLTEQA